MKTLSFSEIMVILDRIKKADDSVKGTSDYNKYKMETSMKYDGEKKWTWLGWSIPSYYFEPNNANKCRAVIKNVKNNIYLVLCFNDNGEQIRYVIRDSVKELIKEFIY